MQTVLVVVLGLHGLAGVFWAGATFVLARIGGAGADRLFAPMTGAGGGVRRQARDGAPAAQSRLAVTYRVSAGLLAIAVVAMVTARHF